MNYKLSKEIPEIYPRLKEAFGVEFKNIIITYGDTIYCLDDLPKHSIAHELIHVEQQLKYGVKEWWDEYIKNPKFRIDQEVPAYQAQVKYLCEHTEEMSQDHRRQWIQKLAEDLSGPMYGKIISLKKAKELVYLW